jgi:type III restriction enzyme
MSDLYEILAEKTRAWREAGYPCEEYPAIGEILDWQTDPESGNLRYLRTPQLRALEVYWYLRAIKGTAHVFDLYRELYPNNTDLLNALGLKHSEIHDYVLNEGLRSLWERLRSDDEFVRNFKLEALRESLFLDYPSYIFALAMGAGKTVLIGAIVATEFAMALEYPEADFAHNALVFAPGKTIVEALRELAEIPYDRILPPRLYRYFAASVKLTFTRDGETNIPVVGGSSFNLIVTNIEKIRITAETIRKMDLGNLFAGGRGEEDAKRAVANSRLQKLASLPNLAIFSDEAHHLYGQALDTRLKRVRQTVNYLADQTRVICVVNTTGTPYYRRQPLKDVVIWYGLSKGISDGYLKELAGNIQAYDFADKVEQYVAHVIKDFFETYGKVRLLNDAPARLAMYFPQTDDLDELRPVIDQALVEVGQSPALCLVNTSLSKQADIDAFNRLNDPAAPHRVILLVNKGTEGWNCPSLFACALVRRLKNSNNFVLQVASRCLRQVPGNTHKARVYLSQDNFSILDRQLQETYGETIADLNREVTETRRARIVLRKREIAPLVVPHTLRTVEPQDVEVKPLVLQCPQDGAGAVLHRRNYNLTIQQATPQVLQQEGPTVAVEIASGSTDAYSAAEDLAALYRLDFWDVYDQLRELYGVKGQIPLGHLPDIAQQIETQTCKYEVREERTERAIALVRPENFNREVDASGAEIYTAEIAYSKDREHLLLHHEELRDNQGDFGFHYTAYNFDSNPEKDFFDQMLRKLNQMPQDVEDIYFTGALTDPAKTDFYVEYKDDKGKQRRYTPDFVIRRKDGNALIVEIKNTHDSVHPIDGEHGRKALALRAWANLSAGRLRYEMIITSDITVPYDRIEPALEFLAAETENLGGGW